MLPAMTCTINYVGFVGVTKKTRAFGPKKEKEKTASGDTSHTTRLVNM